MAYSFTEKKRIRKNFGKQPGILDVPYLLAIQLESYRTFLQENVAEGERASIGLHAAFKTVFPISSYSGNATLEYVSYRLGDPAFEVKECQLRDPGPKVWHDDSDADQPPACERTDRDPSAVDVALERQPHGLDGVFAATVRVPRRRAPVAAPRDELGAALVVQHVDAFRTVDLGDARQLGPAQRTELHCGFHRVTLTHGRVRRAARSACSADVAEHAGPATDRRSRDEVVGARLDSCV